MFSARRMRMPPESSMRSSESVDDRGFGTSSILASVSTSIMMIAR